MKKQVGRKVVREMITLGNIENFDRTQLLDAIHYLEDIMSNAPDFKELQYLEERGYKQHKLVALYKKVFNFLYKKVDQEKHINDKNSNISLSRKRGSKADLCEIILIIEKLQLFEKSGAPISQIDLIKVFESLLGYEIKDFHGAIHDRYNQINHSLVGKFEVEVIKEIKQIVRSKKDTKHK